jgi:carbon storage regulator
MLVLTRKAGEKIWIGDNVCVTVLDIGGGKVRVGVEAPREVPVHRQEILAAARPRKAPPTVPEMAVPALTPRLTGAPD